MSEDLNAKLRKEVEKHKARVIELEKSPDAGDLELLLTDLLGLALRVLAESLAKQAREKLDGKD